VIRGRPKAPVGAGVRLGPPRRQGPRAPAAGLIGIGARSPLLAVALLVLLLTGCARPPDLIGIDNPAVPVASIPDLTRHRVFIATTREDSEVVGAFFSGARAPDLGLAAVDVTVPPTHVTGQLERPTRLPPDPRREFAVVDPVVFGDERSFVAAIDRELAARPPEERRLLVFIHGYNNTASDAILRLTQFVEDTGFSGVPVVFTWASAARLPRYVYDLNSALIARGKFRGVADILVRTNAESVDILAHSMGSFLLMEGLVEAQRAGILGRRKTISHIMLASPDIDIDLFRTQIAELPREIRERMYLFVSRNDGALRISRRIAGGVPRVGAADTAELEGYGLTVIDLSEVEDSSSGSHSKFTGSPEVVRLIGYGLRSAGRFGESPALDQLLAGAPIRIVGN
jgi:esterase/lipase superfamily enzyme